VPATAEAITTARKVSGERVMAASELMTSGRPVPRSDAETGYQLRRASARGKELPPTPRRLSGSVDGPAQRLELLIAQLELGRL
jgi:hypothetical protein